ncbi:MAG: hypothetical protein H6736_08805 [Alphaproteobacteria bacterium]|nr:hypothetical protein [Alphaproteobacteria bacterium]MCB9691901.1 hypothetical protein [Alphaproteobacteria bacterium]
MGAEAWIRDRLALPGPTTGVGFMQARAATLQGHQDAIAAASEPAIVLLTAAMGARRPGDLAHQLLVEALYAAVLRGHAHPRHDRVPPLGGPR